VQAVPLAQAIAALPSAALLTDADQRIVALNEPFERLTGYSLDDLAGKNCRVLQTPDTDAGTVATIRAAIQAGVSFSGEILNRRRSGETFWNALLINPVFDDAGAIVGFLSVQADVTTRVDRRSVIADRLKTAELLLDGLPRFTSDDLDEVAQALCDATVQAGAPASVLLQEHDGAHRVLAVAGQPGGPRAVEAARALLGRSDSRTDIGLARLSHHDGADLPGLRLLGVDHAVVLPIMPRRASRGALIALWDTGSGTTRDHVSVADRVERLADLGGLALDNLELIDRIRAAAQRDDLTGLAARAVVQTTIERALSTGEGPIAVLYLDVDRFKRINDSLGHAGGDALLVQIAARISTAVGSRATVGRLGGDEFIVVAPGAGQADALELQRSIAAGMSGAFHVGGRTVFARVSSGAAVGGLLDGEDVAEGAARIVQEADTAMYAAKRHDQSTGDIDSPFDLVALEVDLRRAIDADEIRTWFQPQYDGRTGALRGFEALARWRHPTLGWIEPDVFVPLAEDASLIGAIGASVLAGAADFADDHVERFGPITMCVNVSKAELLSDASYVDRVERLLADRRRSDWDLALEIKEGDLEHVDGRLDEILVELRRSGIAIAIDDFGSGSSSLRLLQELPVTALKVDKSFLRRTGALREGLITAIVNLGLSLGLEVMAEGVESRAQLDTLRRLRCGSVQGFLLGAPAPATRAAAVPLTAEGALLQTAMETARSSAAPRSSTR
jgi:diguanylate cyclase (GGDEF)-like protein/PAS domain S-box-containing protein